MKLTIEHLATRRGGFVAGPVSAELASGDCLALMGANGAGKTTLLETLAGFFAPFSGRLLLDGEDITTRVPERRHFAYLPQDLALFPHLDVMQNVAYATRRGRTAATPGDVAAIIDEFDLGHLSRLFPHQLSRGQAQRVALARALAAQPRLLLLDEPTASLDAPGQRNFMLHMRRLLAARRLAVIYATHNVLNSLSLATRLIVLHHGRMIQAGTPASLFRAPADGYVAGLLGITNLWPVGAVTESAGGAIAHAGGHQFACARGPTPAHPGFIAIGSGEVELLTDAPGDRTNCLEATVQTLQVSGHAAVVELECALAGLRATLPPALAEALSIGQRVWVRLPADRLRLIAKPDAG